ncbi:MAG TPA: D-arabinono-1,4-lactone oxidase [Microlunatus sp.]|nr:D-arabinono-1,4-lactone oxidase [Microlunatus sp.]
MATWSNWSGLATAHPAQELTPHDSADVVEAVVTARDQNLTVKMTGSGHSFTDIAVADGILLRPDSLRGIIGVDHDAMTVTALAGTPLHELNRALQRLDLSLHNLGDIEEQTLAGAISTGTHGTGGHQASLSAQVTGLELVTGEGDLLSATAEENPDVLEVARLGLGALGILTSVTLRVEPLFTLEAVEAPMRWDRALADFDEMVGTNEHFEMYWFPHTDRLLTKRNNRTLDDAEPLSRTRAWFDDQFLANRVFGWVNRLGNARPGLVPRLNGFAARALSERRYSDVPHKVFTSRRAVVFREMEYGVPRDAGLHALRDLRTLVEHSDWRIGFPVEVRTAPADGVPLSPASADDTVYLAVHVNAQSDHRDYFNAVEALMRSHGGRPHWGKLHSRTAEDLEQAYPRWQDFQVMRDRLDPGRVFTNPYLDRVLGE